MGERAFGRRERGRKLGGRAGRKREGGVPYWLEEESRRSCEDGQATERYLCEPFDTRWA